MSFTIYAVTSNSIGMNQKNRLPLKGESKKGEKNMNTQTNSLDLRKQYSDIFKLVEQTLEIPEGYKLASIKDTIQQNGKPVLLIRYTPESNKTDLYGEHFSVTVEKETNYILGFTNMNRKFNLIDNKLLLTHEETEQIAKDFLTRLEPGYFEKLENLWIDQHDEEIIINDKKMTISGMKYKCYLPETENYTWVIVGSDGDIVTFERGIIWVNSRVTEKWLHDSYLDDQF